MDIEKLRDLVHDSCNRLMMIDWQFKQIEKEYSEGATQERMFEQFASCRQSLKVLNLILTTINSNHHQDKWIELNSCVKEYKKQQGQIDELKIHVIENYKDTMVQGLTNIVLWRLLDNLLMNARNQGSNHVVIEVTNHFLGFTDNGGGVDDSILEKIQRGERISVKGPSGGRGYSQITSLCKILGWSFDVRNRQHENGRGLCVRLNFDDSHQFS